MQGTVARSGKVWRYRVELPRSESWRRRFSTKAGFGTEGDARRALNPTQVPGDLMPRSIQEILGYADELAQRFEDAEPEPGDERPVEKYRPRMSRPSPEPAANARSSTPSPPPAPRACPGSASANSSAPQPKPPNSATPPSSRPADPGHQERATSKNSPTDSTSNDSDLSATPAADPMLSPAQPPCPNGSHGSRPCPRSPLHQRRTEGCIPCSASSTDS